VTLEVRGAREADLPALCRVASAAFAAGFAGIVDAAAIAARTPESFLGRFSARLGDVRVAVADGVLAGFSLLTGAHLDMLFVDPVRQGRGAGRALLADALARGCATLESFAANGRARRFYERAGFRPAETYRRPYEGRDTEFVLYRFGRADPAGPDRS
jgi:putative acetyltransferase